MQVQPFCLCCPRCANGSARWRQQQTWSTVLLCACRMVRFDVQACRRVGAPEMHFCLLVRNAAASSGHKYLAVHNHLMTRNHRPGNVWVNGKLCSSGDKHTDVGEGASLVFHVAHNAVHCISWLRLHTGCSPCELQ